METLVLLGVLYGTIAHGFSLSAVPVCLSVTSNVLA